MRGEVVRLQPAGTSAVKEKSMIRIPISMVLVAALGGCTNPTSPGEAKPKVAPTSPSSIQEVNTPKTSQSTGDSSVLRDSYDNCISAAGV